MTNPDSQTKATTWALLLLAALCVPTGRAADTSPAIKAQTLANGLRVAVVCFPGSTNVSLFTFLPLGATTDGPGQTQWSHLIEHLVIRSTASSLTECNAETAPDHLRLDFYGHTGNWQQGLAHHRRWLEGVPFTAASLKAEKPKVNEECDNVARWFATHKFAVHAWAQGFRHGHTNVWLKGDVTRATLPEVQRLRDDHLVVSNRVTFCIVGGLEPKRAFAEAERQLGRLRLPSSAVAPVKSARGNLSLTWDLDARHLLLTWPIPDFRQADHAALLVAALCLNQSLAAASQLAGQTGMAFAGADLATPETNLFYVSASLRPGADFDKLRQALLERVGRLATDPGSTSQAPLFGQALSAQLKEVPPLEMLMAQVPPEMKPAMVEGNVGIQLGMAEHRYGQQRTALALRLAAVSAADVQRVARKYLAEGKLAACSLRPASAR